MKIPLKKPNIKWCVEMIILLSFTFLFNGIQWWKIPNESIAHTIKWFVVTIDVLSGTTILLALALIWNLKKLPSPSSGN